MVTLKRNVNGMTLLMPHGRKKRIRKKIRARRDFTLARFRNMANEVRASMNNSISPRKAKDVIKKKLFNCKILTFILCQFLLLTFSFDSKKLV